VNCCSVCAAIILVPLKSHKSFIGVPMTFFVMSELMLMICKRRWIRA
jgi:hypothetical protein